MSIVSNDARFYTYLKLFTGIVVWSICASEAVSQFRTNSSDLPDARYYQSFFEFYQGDYKDAAQDFERGAARAFRIGDSRFLDSVCYWTMIGECHYHTGSYEKAIEYYETALNLYADYSANNWQSRVVLPSIILNDAQAVTRPRIDWAQSERNFKVARVPNNFSVRFGLDINKTLVEGGRLDPDKLRQVDVAEIMRCTALALHRRRTIKGPTCQYDPFSLTLEAKLRGHGGGNGTLLGAFNGVLLGIARASKGDNRAAASMLAKSLQFGDGRDHPLTPVALVELARMAVEMGDYKSAGRFAKEASISAAIFNQYDLVEEAISLATTVHLMTERTPFEPLKPAIAWAARNKARLMQASLTVRLAECFAEAGDPDSTERVLGEATRPMKRSEFARTVVSRRMQYINALIEFQRGRLGNGMEQLGEALDQFQNGSLWLYQLGMADDLFVAGNITNLQGDRLYSVLLRDPTAEDWRIDPMESMAFLRSPHLASLARWFEIKVANKRTEEALEVGDLLKRHRFFAQLPLGGRLLAFRWVLEAPPEALTKEALRQRTDFFTRFPAYKSLSDQARKTQTELMALPLKPEKDSPELKKQTDLFVKLSKISARQEAILASHALRREPADLVFPPPLDLSSYRQKIREDQVAMVTVATPLGYHVFLVGQNVERYVGMGTKRDVEKQVGNLLKKLGLKDNSGGVEVKTLSAEEWKEPAHEIAKTLFAGATDEDWKLYKELVIVPDGVLWYLPFEILQLGDDVATATPLSDKTNIRYSPTLSLAYGAQRPERRIARSAVVSARMHPKGEAEHSKTVVDEILSEVPTAVDFSDRMKIPSNYFGAILDQLVVCSDLKNNSKSGNPFLLNPIQLDQGRKGSSLGAWLSLPWAGPEYIVLPGFTSGGAAGLRSKGDGSEMYLTSVALLASGSRSVMLSRWRVGGQNSLRLVQEYTKRISSGEDPVEALKAGINLARELELDIEKEPRIKDRKLAAPLKAEHPFFWAGNLQITIPDAKTDAAPVEVPDANGKDDDLKKVPEAKDAGGQNKDDKAMDDDQAAPLPDDRNVLRQESEKKDKEPPKKEKESDGNAGGFLLRS